jgi:hypothetical protein
MKTGNFHFFATQLAEAATKIVIKKMIVNPVGAMEIEILKPPCLSLAYWVRLLHQMQFVAQALLPQD